ncbi:thiamine pyrophosphate-binding protein [Labrenzia sp. CE80]|uniref:thiamine pyrophosphate-binding protein n=1 Tax=Labrenzia sp. CE80 TaxID=1788986 RepID=UPI00129A0F67|nr:thiamine pyrophosphate-binding protein [Labrenzia sp. CE80]
MSKALETKSSADQAAPSRSGGRILADQLALLGADKVFCVPGESFLGLLEGLYAHQNVIQVISCRHESGAANMADAYGKMTGLPGIVAVTRGPGATNASNGVHTAYQDSTPMIVLIGQVGRSMMDREAFQEMDYRRMFGEMAKWVAQIDDATRIPEYLSRAWKVALSGRPGPVVLALPEDMLTDEVIAADLKPTPLPKAAPQPSAMVDMVRMLQAAEKPLLVVGGPGWNQACCEKAVAVSEKFGLPVATSFRCQDYFDNSHANYVGVIGIAPSPKLRKRVMDEVDLMIAVGPRFGEMTTQGYTLLDIPTPQMKLVHVHPGAEELGQVYAPDLSIVSSPEAFLDAALQLEHSDCSRKWEDWLSVQNADYKAFLKPTEVPGDVNMSEVIKHITDTMPSDTIISNGAGNYTVWVHRFHKHTDYRTQLAPTSGSMGYSQPAAIAAKLIDPSREVISLAGDGCFMMAGQELATAKQYGADVIYIVVNNGMFGTIRMHQERNHPGHVIATELVNPDFVTFAKAFGIDGERVDRTDAFPEALKRARKAKGGYLIEIVVDAEALTPSQSLSDARRQGEAALTN